MSHRAQIIISEERIRNLVTNDNRYGTFKRYFAGHYQTPKDVLEMLVATEISDHYVPQALAGNVAAPRGVLESLVKHSPAWHSNKDWGPLGLYGEYIISDQEVVNGPAADQLQHAAWQVAASYVLTGEKNSWRGITPKRPFAPGNGGWGAFEIAARFQHLDVDDDTFPTFASATSNATEANSWGVGLNWHLNRNFKLQVNYEYTDFKGGTPELLLDGEQVIFTRAQISF